MGTQLYILRGSPALQGLPQLTGGREHAVVDRSLTGLPGWGVVFLLHFEKWVDTLFRQTLLWQGNIQVNSKCELTTCKKATIEVKKAQWECVYVRVHSGLAVFSFLPCRQNSLSFPLGLSPAAVRAVIHKTYVTSGCRLLIGYEFWECLYGISKRKIKENMAV